jgi:hypothetical protein
VDVGQKMMELCKVAVAVPSLSQKAKDDLLELKLALGDGDANPDNLESIMQAVNSVCAKASSSEYFGVCKGAFSQVQFQHCRAGLQKGVEDIKKQSGLKASLTCAAELLPALTDHSKEAADAQVQNFKLYVTRALTSIAEEKSFKADCPLYMRLAEKVKKEDERLITIMRDAVEKLCFAVSGFGDSQQRKQQRQCFLWVVAIKLANTNHRVTLRVTCISLARQWCLIAHPYRAYRMPHTACRIPHRRFPECPG